MAECGPPVTAIHVCWAAASFSSRTASGPDGQHVRQAAWLSNEALEYLASAFSFAAGTGMVPAAMAVPVAPLVPKQEGRGRDL